MIQGVRRTVWTALICFITVLLASTGTVFARCGSVGMPSYDDVDAVMFSRNGCGSRVGSLAEAAPHWRQAKKFGCSAYWVLFWNNGREDVPTQYSQFDLIDEVGTYTLEATLQEARDILQKDRFFLLSPQDVHPTDTAQATVSVRHCAVVTSITVPTTGLNDLETNTLILDMGNLVKNSGKRRVSPAPKGYELNLLFYSLPPN